MNKRYGKYVFLLLLAGILIALGFYTYDNKKEKANPVSNSNIVEQNKDLPKEENTVENVIENTVPTEDANNENEVKHETEEVKDNVQQETPVNAESEKTTTTSSFVNEEDTAKKIVEKDWGNNDGVYFTVMGMNSSGKYIVTVNDSETSAVLAWYTVDVEAGTFEK